MPINIVSGSVQAWVMSYKNPIKIGPTAANKYPMDCAIPESSAESFGFFARIDKNESASVKLVLEAIPIKVIAITMIEKVGFINKLKIPMMYSIFAVRTNGLWECILIATIGIIKLIGMPIN